MFKELCFKWFDLDLLPNLRCSSKRWGPFYLMGNSEYGHDQCWEIWMDSQISFSGWYDAWYPHHSSCWSWLSTMGYYAPNQRFSTCLRSSSSSLSFLWRCSSGVEYLAQWRITAWMIRCSCPSSMIWFSCLVLFWNPM